MMQKIINTMFYGSLKAKIFLWSVFIMILATVLMGVLAAVLGSSVFVMGAVVCGIAAFITSQSVSLSELQRQQKKSGGKKQSGGKTSPSQKKEKEGVTEESVSNSREKAKEKARYMASMNEKKMKQLLKEHKVNQIHVFVMVDSFPEQQIVQTPAVMWRTDTHLQLLMLDGSGREVSVPLQDIKGIYYHKNVPANPQEDYPSFQYANFMSKLYKPYLPACQEVTRDGELAFVKNLFTVEPGISFTNTSMKGVFKILNKVPLLVDDSINMSPRYDEYFKEVYRYSILCKNGIFTLEEYREKMEQVLQELITAPISSQQFAKSMRDMNRYHLITSEYVTKYTQIYITKHQVKK